MSEPVEKLAKKWKCDVRTIGRWKRAGAPLSDPARMRTWLASRKNLPPETRAMMSEKARSRRSSDANSIEAQDLTTGAPAALRRLETVEARAFELLDRAMRRGDPHEVKLARQGWLEVGDSLRRYDLLVERSRRDSGELVNLAETQAYLEHFLTFLKMGIVRAANSIAPKLAGAGTADACDMVREACVEQILCTLGAMTSSRCAAKLPEWFSKPITKALSDSYEGVPEAVDARRLTFEKSFGNLAEIMAGIRTETAEPSNPNP